MSVCSLNPQEAIDFRSSASYSHRGSLVVHEVSFPGNTFKLASTCSIVSGDVVARQKTEASARFFLQRSMPLQTLKDSKHQETQAI